MAAQFGTSIVRHEDKGMKRVCTGWWAAFLTRSVVAALTAAISLWGVQAMAADGLTTIKSSHGPEETMERLEAAVKTKGLTVFARIDHAAGAAEVGLSLRPTELLIFGNARVVRR